MMQALPGGSPSSIYERYQLTKSCIMGEAPGVENNQIVSKYLSF